MTETLNCPEIMRLIELAIEEDIGTGDVTSFPLFSQNDVSHAIIFSKEEGIFCGHEIAGLVYGAINPEIIIDPKIYDGNKITNGTEVIHVKGPTIGILQGERIVLNFIQRLCGIATKTNYFTEIIKNRDIQILDTRKTLPGFRKLDKYAVKTGGGTNHRMGLYDMVMIKDNHIKSAGSITNAVKIIRDSHKDKFKIEVETTNLNEVHEALKAGADIIMLDNMDKNLMEEAAEIISKKAKIEVSGNVDKEKLKDLLDLKIDYISIGALTHSVNAFDLSMKFK